MNLLVIALIMIRLNNLSVAGTYFIVKQVFQVFETVTYCHFKVFQHLKSLLVFQSVTKILFHT